MTQVNPNLTLWNAVETTDPNFTKPFKRGGGFSGTATNVTYQLKKATELFGPVGIGFGWTVMHEEILTGRDDTMVHKLRIEFWYEWSGKIGKIESFGQTEFSGKRSSGNLYTDEEAPKKSLTDAISKALSWLGFSADVHMGKYDDNKYVEDLKKKYGQDGKAVELILATIQSAKTEKELDMVTHDRANTAVFNRQPPELQDEIMMAVEARRAELAGGKSKAEATPQVEKGPKAATEGKVEPEAATKQVAADETRVGLATGYSDADSRTVGIRMAKELKKILDKTNNIKTVADWNDAKKAAVDWANANAREKGLLIETDKVEIQKRFDEIQAALRAKKGGA